MKKFLPYILILAVLIGTFVPAVDVEAQTPMPDPPAETIVDCTTVTDYGSANPSGNDNTEFNTYPGIPFSKCAAYRDAYTQVSWKLPGASGNAQILPPAPTQNDESALSQSLDQCISIMNGSLIGCLERLIYIVFVAIPSFLLSLIAKMFNYMAKLTLSSEVYKYDFIDSIWRIVRDFANIFFILVLLYAAIELILGLGHGSAKKTIINVIIFALLVNFSLFATRVVIDSGNILGLIFYNKITVEGSNYTPINKEPDIAGALSSAFNVNKFFSPELLNNLQLQRDVSIGTAATLGLVVAVPLSFFFPPVGLSLAAVSLVGGISSTLNSSSATLLIAMMVAYGLVIYSMTYAFFIVALSFLGRMMSLIMLMIVSPFAFVSYAVPKLKSIDTIGFDSWVHKLLESSFVATIFMFILYVISEILRAQVFLKGVPDSPNASFTSVIILIFMPAILITILLLKGAKYAQKASGELTEKIVGYGKAITGLVAGGAIGGAALLGTGGLGNLASRAAGSTALNTAARKKGFGGMTARMALGAADYGKKASFDLRKVPGMGGLTKLAGINLEAAKAIGLGSKEGGYEKRRAETVKKRQERAKQLEVREDETLKQNLNRVERDLQNLLNEHSKELSELDKLIEKKRETLRDVTARFGGGSPEAQQAGLELQNVKDRKKALKDGQNYLGDKNLAGVVTGTNAKNYTSVNAGTYVDAAGVPHTRTINHMEDVEIVDRKDEIEKENRERKWAYAKRLEKRGKTIAFAKAAAMAGAGYKLGVPATLGLSALGYPIVGGAITAGALSIPLAQEDKRANREAAHKIIMGAKLDTEGKSGGH